MLTLGQDFPDIADEIVAAARSDAELQEALADYEHACAQLHDEENRARDRAQWAEIRAELVIEIRQIFLRLEQK